MMATFNGESHIEEQIKSIQSQTYQNWTLLIRDDNSNDKTKAIIERFAKDDLRIKLLIDSLGNLGSNSNFSELMKKATHSSAQYFCFSDQDDFWQENKLEIMLSYVKELESLNGIGTPILVYSDLEVVDFNLQTLVSSFMSYQGLAHPTRDILGRVLVQNIVTGCASFFNRSLLKIARQVPPSALVHDWWLALCAASCGLIEFLPFGLVKYRQHGKNQIGAKGYTGRHNPFKKEFYVGILNSKKNALNVINQSKCLWALKSNFVDESIDDRLVMLGKIETANLFSRLKILKNLRVSRSKFLDTLFLYLRFLFL
jgi:glycosyltransferase involved in cell wall biosynthesis